MKNIISILALSISLAHQTWGVTYYSDGVNGLGADPADATELLNWTTDPTATNYGAPFSNPANFTNPGDEFRILDVAAMYCSSIWTLTPTSTLYLTGTSSFSTTFDNTYILRMDGESVYKVEDATYNNTSFSSLCTIDSKLFVTGATTYRNINYPCSVEYDLSSTLNLTDNANSTRTILGSFIVTAIAATVNFSNRTSASTINIGKDIQILAGSVRMVNSSGSPTVNIGGSLVTFSGSSYRGRNTGASGTPTLNFTGTGEIRFDGSVANSIHNITINGTSITLETNFTVSSPGALTLTAGTLTLQPSTTLTLGGAVNVTSGTLTGSSSSNITFSGSGAATLPAVTLGTLTINRAASTVSLGGNVTVTTLNLNNGALSIGSNTLNVINSIAQTSGSVTGGSSSNLIFETSATSQTVPSASYNNLTLNNTNGSQFFVGIGGVTVTGTLTLTESAFNNSTNTLTLGNGATIVRNDEGVAGSLTAAPAFGTSVNVSYTGNEAITAGNELPSSTTVLNNLTLNNVAGLTLASARTANGAITLTAGVLSSGGNLTLNLNLGYIANTGSGSISGNLICTKTISRSAYTYLGSPLQGSITFPTTSFFDRYDEPTHDRDGDNDAGWQSASTSQTVGSTNIMRGYAAYYEAGSTALSVSGTYSHNTDYSITVTRTNGPGDAADDNGWNLVANPFPSSFDWEDLANSGPSVFPANVSAQIQFWNGSAYTAYTAGVPTQNDGALGKIAPFQGFFMQVSSGTSATLTFPNANRINGTKALTRKKSFVEDVLQIEAKTGAISDKTYVRLKNDALPTYDNSYDAIKLDNYAEEVMVWTEVGENRYAINAFPFDEKAEPIALNIKSPNSSAYTLNFSENAPINSGLQIFLIDKLLNKTQDIRLNPIYNASLVKGDNKGRFYLSFQGELTSLDEVQNIFSASVGDANTVNTFFKNVSSKTARIDLFNTLGTNVYSNPNADISSNKFSFIPSTNSSDKVYILKATVGNRVYTQKILLNQ